MLLKMNMSRFKSGHHRPLQHNVLTLCHLLANIRFALFANCFFTNGCLLIFSYGDETEHKEINLYLTTNIMAGC